MIANVLKGWFTGADNCSFEIGRALWALCIVGLLVFEGAAVFGNLHFDATGYATAAAAILAAGGFGIAAKDKANSGAS